MILASTSKTRANMLRNAGVSFSAQPPYIDELAMKDALLQDGVNPRDISDAIAEAKAKKISNKFSSQLVLGCDQALDFQGRLISKAKTKETLMAQMQELRGNKHKLYAAVVFAYAGAPIWRYVGEAQIMMRDFSDKFINQYIDQNFDDIRHSVGGYQIEGQGAQLIEDYRGDYFSILGLPLFAVLGFLRQYGELES